MTLLTRVSADDYLAEGETEEHRELIEGEIVVMNSPLNRHQALAAHILFELMLWCRGGDGRGFANIEVDHRLDDHNVFAPDLWWVREERRPARDATRLVGPPDGPKRLPLKRLTRVCWSSDSSTGRSNRVSADRYDSAYERYDLAGTCMTAGIHTGAR